MVTPFRSPFQAAAFYQSDVLRAIKKSGKQQQSVAACRTRKHRGYWPCELGASVILTVCEWTPVRLHRVFVLNVGGPYPPHSDVVEAPSFRALFSNSVRSGFIADNGDRPNSIHFCKRCAAYTAMLIPISLLQ